MTNEFRNESLEHEIQEAGGNAEARELAAQELTVPDKFRDKSPEDIIKSYQELEKAYGRQAQTVGQLRKAVDQMLEFRDSSSSAREEPPKPLSVDDIYENPDDAVRRVVREETTGKLKEVQEELARTRRELTLKEFEARHPNWRETVKDPAFANWVEERPHRLRLAAAADQYDFDAAEELFGLYEEATAGRRASEESQRRDQQLSQAGLETGSAAPAPKGKTFSRYELMQKRIAANRGNRDAAMWLQSNAEAVQRAYAEGRIVD